jgi:alcohol dehydrogenase (NADP+)
LTCIYRSMYLALQILIVAAAVLPRTTAEGSQNPIHGPTSPIEAIPAVGLGLWNSRGIDATNAVNFAFSAGYVHLDSASAYGNEDEVGLALSSTSAPARQKYWITSKLWNNAHQPRLVRPAIEKTLADLQVPYLDLYLMHWPVAFLPNQGGRTVLDQETSVLDTWTAMEELVALNLTRYIGVSNFSPRQLDNLLAKCKIRPAAHEFETHPYLQQQEFVNWHISNNISVIAYSPLANLNPTYDDKYPDMQPIIEDLFWTELAGKKNVTAAQAILAWGRQRGTVVIPKSTHQKRIVENLASSKVALSREDMRAIAEQDKRARFNNPSKSWGVELFEGLDDGPNRFLVQEEL